MRRLAILILIFFFVVGCRTTEIDRKGDNEAERAVSKLTKMLQHRRPKVRIEAVQRLSRYNVPSSWQVLEGAAESDKDERVRAAAKKALQGMTGLSRPVESSNLAFGDSRIEIWVQPQLTFDNGHKVIRPVAQKGILPFSIRLKNLSATPIQVDTNLIGLIMPDGTKIRQVKTDELKQKLEYSASAALRLAFRLETPSSANKDVHERVEKSKIESDTVSKGETLQGYVFFDVPKNLRAIKGWTFEIGLKQNNRTFMLSRWFL